MKKFISIMTLGAVLATTAIAPAYARGFEGGHREFRGGYNPYAFVAGALIGTAIANAASGCQIMGYDYYGRPVTSCPSAVPVLAAPPAYYPGPQRSYAAPAARFCYGIDPYGNRRTWAC